jgi:hypothetical protein
MKFETFKAGVWTARYQYKSFEPVLVDHEWLWQDPAINTLLESANRALGELNAFSLIVPDIDLFIEMHVVKEAQTSSRIEGTQTGMDEALMPEDQIEPEKRDDWREVRNYVDAVNSGHRRAGDPAAVEPPAEAHPRNPDARGAWRAQAAGRVPQQPELDRRLQPGRCGVHPAAPGGVPQ